MNIKDTVQNAKIYLYILGNLAKENGFKPVESWHLNFVDFTEKQNLEANYYPTHTIILLHEDIMAFIAALDIEAATANVKFTPPVLHSAYDSEKHFLVAYNINRLQ